MPISAQHREYILKSIENLPPRRIEEVIDFIEFLKAKSSDRSSAIDDSALVLQQASLNKIWQNEEDLYEL